MIHAARGDVFETALIKPAQRWLDPARVADLASGASGVEGLSCIVVVWTSLRLIRALLGDDPRWAWGCFFCGNVF
ncbi:hypothetical protein VDG1235_4421 [Verrucomicrobiia bacterium DG1235]|nr:hypothetical protein VDG1235_4421 [Verrucomicrobiae bacterium DG1235]